MTERDRDEVTATDTAGRQIEAPLNNSNGKSLGCISLHPCGEKERLLFDAACLVHGKCLTEEDFITGLVITALPDKTEIFSFLGVNLFHFYHIQSRVEATGYGANLLRAEQSYLKLHDAALTATN